MPVLHQDVKKRQHFLLALLKVSRPNQVSGVRFARTCFKGAAARSFATLKLTGTWGAKGISVW